MTAPVLRPATAADLDWLLGMTGRLADFPVPPWRSRQEIDLADHGLLRERMAAGSPDDLILIAEEPERGRAGYVFVTTRTDYFTGEPHGHVEILVVVPGFEGKGIGRTLLDAAERWSAGRGHRQISLNVFATNERARGIYRRAGYGEELVRYLKRLG